MDRVRFGRAIGGGARDAARAILKAADAAASPNPSTPRPSANQTSANQPFTSQARATPAPTPVITSPPHISPLTTERLRRGSKNFGQAIWSPLVRQSGVLWLEFTGVFFGLFAVTAALATWKHRHDLLTASPARPQAVFALAMLIVFGYFTCSSFFKAARRGKR